MAELLIVDDEEALRRWAQRVVCDRGYAGDVAGDAREARAHLERNDYELVLLDVNMPGESGLQLLSHIRSEHPSTAVVMVTGEDDMRLAMNAIELGAYGYVVKPVASGELLIHVVNALRRRRLELETRALVARLTRTAAERFDRLQEALGELQKSQSQVRVSEEETTMRLARVVEFRDEETGHHIQRMGRYCERLAQELGIDLARAGEIRLASQLHDVGKVAVPDGILRKQGKLTEREMDVIRTHAEIGHRMLAGSSSEVVQLGAVIAHTHHERWDGTGYPRGLAREQIPIEGRIAAVADVFDALTSDRVYRPAFPLNTAVDMMSAQRGAHFQPEVLDRFIAVLDDIKGIRRAYAD